MKFESDVKYDFKDVLIRPKRSSLSSRQDVTLEREFVFRHGRRATWVPIIAANMDHVGTIEMAAAFQPYGMSVALHKHYAPDVLVSFFSEPSNLAAHWYTMGIGASDLDKFGEVSRQISRDKLNICIDVANGYQESFVQFIQKFRDQNPNAVIMAGNVVTGVHVTQQYNNVFEDKTCPVSQS